MSEAKVTVTTITSLVPHSNADRLEIANILGWQVVVGKGSFSEGTPVLYVPPDTVVPTEWADKWGVTNYLGSNNRVRAVKLRGEPSYGFAVPLTPNDETATVVSDYETRKGLSAREEENYAEAFGITKYFPPIRVSAGDVAPENVLFEHYTDIENLRNYPSVFIPAEPVYITEKIHGTNCRVGVIEGEFVAGSHRFARKRPEGNEFAKSEYWFPFSLPEVRKFLSDYAEKHKVVILFGEVYGKIQKLHYGNPNGLSFAAFDLFLDGKYVDAIDFYTLMTEYSIPTVPLLEVGPFSLERVQELVRGKTTYNDTHIREGVVLRPERERRDPVTGRVILKYLSDAYLLNELDNDTTDV